MSTNNKLTEADCVIRGTALRKGRTRWTDPGSAPLRHLRYSRTVLDENQNRVAFSNPGEETGLICLKGRSVIRVSDEHAFELGPYDGLYVPRDESVEIIAFEQECDLAEFSAPVDGHYPLQFIPFTEVRRNPGLSFRAGGESYSRQVNIVIGENVQAGRILAGVTFSDPGNWTSWPPHEHGEMLEEAYLFIDMPTPSWGLQFVYTQPGQPEVAALVREGDCVLIPEGYHPNVAAPNGRINFLWMMAARREAVDRRFGVVNVQPEYCANGSGLEAGRST